MKKILYIICFGCLPLAANAQQVNEQMIKIGKGEVTGFVVQSTYETATVEDAIASKLKEAGIKTHGKKKKLYTYKDISLPAISSSKVDLYYKVQKKKHVSKIYFIVSKGYDNYISTATDPAIATNITNFLSKIDGNIANNQAIQQKEADLKKIEDDKKQKEQELEALKKNSNG